MGPATGFGMRCLWWHMPDVSAKSANVCWLAHQLHLPTWHIAHTTLDKSSHNTTHVSAQAPQPDSTAALSRNKATPAAAAAAAGALSSTAVSDLAAGAAAAARVWPAAACTGQGADTHTQVRRTLCLACLAHKDVLSCWTRFGF